MSRFKVGDRVQIVKSTAEDLNGMFGVIRKKGDGWDWWVTLEAGAESLGFDNYELAPAPQEPALTGAAGADDASKLRAWAFSWQNGNHISVDELNAETRKLIVSHDSLRAKLAAAIEVANDYRDQIWVHQGTLRVLKSWLSKADGFSAEDGFTEAAILGMVERDLEASEKMDTRTMQAANALADGAGEAGE